MQQVHSVESHKQLLLLLHIVYRLSHHYRSQHFIFILFINNKEF